MYSRRVGHHNTPIWESSTMDRIVDYFKHSGAMVAGCDTGSNLSRQTHGQSRERDAHGYTLIY